MPGLSVHGCCSLTSPLIIFSSPLSIFFPNVFMFILIDHMCLIKLVWWKGCGYFRHLTFLLPSIIECLWVLSSRSFEGTVIHSYLKNPWKEIFPCLSLIMMQMENQGHDLKHSDPLPTSGSTPLSFSLPFPFLSHFLSALQFPSPPSVYYMLTQICQIFADKHKQIQVIKFLCLKIYYFF